MISVLLKYLENLVDNDSQGYLYYLILTCLIVFPFIFGYFLLFLRKIFLEKTEGKKQIKYYLFQSFFIPIVLIQFLVSFYLFFALIFNGTRILNTKFFQNIDKIIWIITLTVLVIRFTINFGIKYLGSKYILSKTNVITLQVSIKLINALIIISQILLILHISGINIKLILLITTIYSAVIISYVVLNTALRISYHKMIKKVTYNGNYWIYVIAKSFYIPLHILMVIETFFIAYKFFILQFPPTVYYQNIINKLHAMSIVGLITVALIKFIQNFEEQLVLGRLTKINPKLTTVQASGKLLRVIVFVIVLIITLPILGTPLSAILTFSGASAVVVGIAIRPILANYFGGFLIYTENFFEVGDWIYSSEKNIEGTVEYIGWRSTRIRTFDKRPLYVPNSYFSEISVINASRMENRRIKEDISIRYQDSDSVEKITEDIKTMLINHPEIDNTKTLLVHFLKFGDFSINLNIYAFTKTCNWEKYRDVQQDVFLKCISIIKDNGAKVAIPTKEVYYKNFKE